MARSRILPQPQNKDQPGQWCSSDRIAPVAAFLDGALLYALSKMWADLLSIYVLPLQPEPYCELEVNDPCRPYAPASEQWGYAIFLLFVATMVDWVIAALEWRAPGLASLRPMVSAECWVLGWPRIRVSTPDTLGGSCVM